MTISKFRVWDKKWSEWEKDVFVGFDGRLYQKSKNTVYGVAVSAITRDDIILMQSTGLFDMYDKEIFEGDVLQTSDSELAKVVWNKELACWEAEFLSEIVDLSEVADVKSNRSDCEIVGNIYENPELVEEVK